MIRSAKKCEKKRIREKKSEKFIFHSFNMISHVCIWNVKDLGNQLFLIKNGGIYDEE